MDKKSWGAKLRGGESLTEMLVNTPTTAVGAAVVVPDLHVGRGIRFGNLTWFPVWTAAPVSPRSYRTETKTKVTVSELAQATVPLLEVDNQGDLPLVLFEGTLLEGGRQHRALTRSLVVESHTRREIPVACVEQSRWSGAPGQRFGARTAPAKVRSAMRGVQFDAAGRAQQGASDQSKVWRSVAEYESRYLDWSGDSSLVNLHANMDISAQAQLDAPEPLPGQRGLIVAALGQPLALELFDHPDTLAERFESLLRGYQLDAADQAYQPTPFMRARDFAIAVQSANLEAVAEGPEEKQLRAAPDARCATEALAYKDQLLHLASINPRHSLALVA